MNIPYWLFVAIVGQTQVVGPFDGLIACEKAASQVAIAVRESHSIKQAAPGTACLSQKHYDFKYKEPKK